MIETLDAMDEGDDALLELVIAEFQTNKARERRFGSRSEAGRYAAQVRWGNRGAVGGGQGEKYGLALEPTDDIAEAMATGRPYAPLLAENFPDDLKALHEQVQQLKSEKIMAGSIALSHGPMGDEEKLLLFQYRQRLTEHYERVMDDGLEKLRVTNPDSQIVLAHEGNPGLRRKFAITMASEQIRRTAQESEIRDKIGTDRAMSYTAGAIDGGPRKRITVSAFEEDALQILAEGRVKTQFETYRSNGMLSLEQRASHEAIAYGTHPFTNPRVRPVYGSLHPHGVRHANQNESQQYGDVHFVMKDSVIGRSTASVEDSLGTVMQPNPARRAVRPQFSSRSKIDKDSPGSAETNNERNRAGRTAPYVEAQIHGGVKIRDIAYIAVSGPPPPSKELRQAARKRGLEIREFPRGDGAKYGNETFEALDDSDVAKSAPFNMTAFLTDAIEKAAWAAAVKSGGLDKARERKFNSRSEAGRYAAQIRWGNRGAQTAEDPAVAALKQEAESIRNEITAMAQRVDFADIPVGNPATGENWHDGPDSPPIIIDRRSGEMIPSPALCDLQDRLIAVGNQLHDRAGMNQKNKASVPVEEAYAGQAARMRAEVGAVRPLGGDPKPVSVALYDAQSVEAIFSREGIVNWPKTKEVSDGLSEVSAVMPRDWMTDTAALRLKVYARTGSNASYFDLDRNHISVTDPALVSSGRFLGSRTIAGVLSHEMTHAVSQARPSVRLAEVAFMAHRTHSFQRPLSSAKPRPLAPLRERIAAGPSDKRIFGVTSSGNKVEVMEDRFSNMYSGRMYGPRGWNESGQNDRTKAFFETLSTGMESYFGGNRQKLDRDHLAFVLGALVST